MSCELRENPRGNSVKQPFTVPPVFVDKGWVTLPHRRQIRVKLDGRKLQGDIMLEQRSDTACGQKQQEWRMEPNDPCP